MVEMSYGLVHASYSLLNWQAVKLTFFAPCIASVKGPEQGCRCCFVDITNTPCMSMEKALVAHTLLTIMRLPLFRSI